MGSYRLKREICTKDIYQKVVKTKETCLVQSLEVLHFVFIEIVYSISLPLFCKWKEIYPDEKWSDEFNFAWIHLESYNILIHLTNEVCAAAQGTYHDFRQYCVESARRWLSVIFENTVSQNTAARFPSEGLVSKFTDSVDDKELFHYADVFEDAIRYKWEKLKMARAYVRHIQLSERMLYKPKRYYQL